MSKGSFQRALAETDRVLSTVPMSSARDREIRASLSGSTRGRRSRAAPALAIVPVGIAVAVVIVAVIVTRGGGATPGDHGPVPIAGFTIHGETSSSRIGPGAGELEVLAPTLVLDVEGFGRVIADRGALVARAGQGVRVLRGRVVVEVAHREPGRTPAIVEVSHGTIAVLGTRFTIDQREDGGRVELHEGRIRFEAPGYTTTLAPGESLTWPVTLRRAAPIAPSGPPAPTESILPPSPPVPPASVSTTGSGSGVDPPPRNRATTTKARPGTTDDLDVDAMLAQLASLRERGQFAESASLLRRVLGDELPAEARERLSYELGELLTHQLAQHAEACRHWRTHRAEFSNGRYVDEVETAWRRLACKEDAP